MKNIIYIVIISILLVSCGGFKEAGKVLRNEKIRTTDEFLVKKRNPLELPPNYEEIPEPGTKSQKKTDEDKTLKKILNVPEINNTQNNKTSSIEELILDRIRK